MSDLPKRQFSCPKCDVAMPLVSVCCAPGGLESFVFECPQCGHSMTELHVSPPNPFHQETSRPPRA